MTTDLLSIDDLDDDEVAHLVRLARSVTDRPLEGQSVALIFEKPSLRTHLSFDIGVYELGGHGVYLSGEAVGLNSREPAVDIARVIERWCTIIVARVHAHDTLRQMADAASIPVVNALSDEEHPCQAMADLTTIEQRLGRLEGVIVAYIGDANNVARSLALACAAVGARFRIASPEGHGLSHDWVDRINARYAGKGATVACFVDPTEAVLDADVVYTDVWTSMGDEHQAAARRKAFEGYQVDEALLDRASPGAILMHDMPAHYGEEVPEGMLTHERSVAFDQAENRLHAQKAVLRYLVRGE